MDFPTYKVTERTYRYGVRIPDSNFFDYLVSTYDLIVDKDGKISPYDTLRITKIDCHMHSISAHYISVHQKFINKQQPC